jgi:hypothetical protein
MATPIYGTPSNWQTTQIGTFTDPKARLLLEIYNQLYALSGGSLPGSSNFFFAATGTGTYTNAALVDKTIDALFSDGVLQTPTVDYTFTTGTGTINWINVPAAAANCWVSYHTT